VYICSKLIHLGQLQTLNCSSRSSSCFRSQGTHGDPVRFSKQHMLGIAMPYFILFFCIYRCSTTGQLCVLYGGICFNHYNCRMQNSKIRRALSILSLKPKFTPFETSVSLFLSSENAKFYDHTCK